MDREGETMSQPEEAARRNTVTRFMIEKALWNCCVSLSLTEILPNLYLGGYVPLPLLDFSHPLPSSSILTQNLSFIHSFIHSKTSTSYLAASNIDSLRATDIAFVLTIMSSDLSAPTLQSHLDMGIVTTRFNKDDRPAEDLLSIFGSTCDLIDEKRAEGKKVLVHCRMGVSRSVTLVMAYRKFFPLGFFCWIRSRGMRVDWTRDR